MTTLSAAEVRANLSGLTDNELVCAHINGEDRTFDHLYARYYTKLHQFIYHAIGDSVRAEDLTQEVFLRVHQYLDRFDPGKKFSTWIYTIASNLAKNELRSRRVSSRIVLFADLNRAFTDDERAHQFVDPRAGPERHYRSKQQLEIVYQSIAQLPVEQRVVFVLRFIEHRKYEEIAELMGTTVGTVKSRLFRSRIAVRAISKDARN